VEPAGLSVHPGQPPPPRKHLLKAISEIFGSIAHQREIMHTSLAYFSHIFVIKAGDLSPNTHFFFYLNRKNVFRRLYYQSGISNPEVTKK
jgi:hypothetical protein